MRGLAFMETALLRESRHVKIRRQGERRQDVMVISGSVHR